MSRFSYIGESVERKDALEKAAGRAVYGDDACFPGLLYAAAVRSPAPRIRIRSIKAGGAAKVPGFAALVTHKDIKGARKWPLVADDYPFLPESESRFQGETLALAVASTRKAAREAARRAEVKYKALPFLDDPLAALEKTALKIHGDDNVFARFFINKGDADKALKEAHTVVTEEFSTNYQVHAYLETQCATAVPEPDGGLTVHSSTQCPFYVLDAVAAVSGLPYNRVKVVQTVTGGGFGGKEDVPALVAAHAALCALKTGRPVRLVYDREEDFLSMSKRHPSRSTVTYAADKNGKLTACVVDYVLDGGAYSTLSPIVLWRGAVHAAGPYNIENVRIEARAAATNKVPSGAFRGFGQPQICFAQESLIDELALKMGMDPVRFRLKNILRPGDRTATGQLVDRSCGLEELLETVRKRSGWDKKKAVKTRRADGTETAAGLGVSLTYYGVGLGAKGRYLDRAGAFVNIYKDGTVGVNVGNTEMGQGALTVLSQICAETLNAPYENIRLETVDTSKVPDSGPTVASRTTLMSGNAILEAAAPLRRRIFAVAYDLLASGGADRSGRMKAFRGGFRMGGISVPFEVVIRECWSRRLKMSEQGWYAAPRTSYEQSDGQGAAYVTYSWSAAAAAVEVDLGTGVIKAGKIFAAYDAGRVINPRLAEGQAQGGILQGLSWSLYENLVHKNGAMLNPNFTDYAAATTADKPEYDITFIERLYAEGPYRAKGLGEVPLIGVAPAVANAVSRASGVRIRSVPILPEKIWAELGGKNPGGQR